MIRVNIEMPKDCNTCRFSVHYNSGGAHGFYCSLSNNPEHRWGEANDDGFKFADCPISVVEYNTQVFDKIRAEIEPKCDRINSLASALPYTAHREIQELLCEIMDLCKTVQEGEE